MKIYCLIPESKANLNTPNAQINPLFKGITSYYDHKMYKNYNSNIK